MLWHAKALEAYTEAFNALQGLHEESDLNDFRTTLLNTLASTDRSGLSITSAGLEATKEQERQRINNMSDGLSIKPDETNYKQIKRRYPNQTLGLAPSSASRLREALVGYC
ncbi:unnamed protein product [Protopolystoma xenopodis]|uniref:Uncharacterized protein n=1 Tax=Protopolystoma xenopodis TaxID=117903 RepID=A0A3S5AK89_9PLAT|nr:unnamed protein product [Protopolystoma xenopodis]